MSSGECLLISLIHFIYNSIIMRSIPSESKKLILIDEIELALHPIATMRLINLLEELMKTTQNLTALVATHSPELIRKIDPRNLFQIENINGIINVNTPCYPSYAIRDVFQHDGFDYLLLVEDKLAKCVITRVLEKRDLQLSKIVHISPVGGWSNVLELQNDLIANNVVGTGKSICSILDGDIESEVGNKYKNHKKLFLPIPSIEKFLFKIMTKPEFLQLKKRINDRYFQIESLDAIFSGYVQSVKEPNPNGKKFYSMILQNLEKRNISEDSFILRLTDDIMEATDFSRFADSMANMLS